MRNLKLPETVRGRSTRVAALLTGLVLALLWACGGDAGGELSRFTFTSELVLTGEFRDPYPVKLAVAPDGRLFYSEYNFRAEPQRGYIRIIGADGQLLEQPFAEVDLGELRDWGLFGLAFDPQFETNHYVYAYYIAPTPDGGGQATVMRFTDVDNRGTDPTPILADLPKLSPANEVHTGGGLLFGPDGYLYLSLGNLAVDEYTQDLSVLPGKIIRINTDGSAAPDNPFVDTPGANPRIFAYGLRNVYDFTFHPITGRMYATDNYSQNCDELNIVDKGQNYGWPPSADAEGCHNPGTVDPIYLYAKPGKKPQEESSNVAPTAIEFLTDSGDLLLTCEANTEFMRLLLLGGPDYDVVEESRIIAEDCKMDIARAPDGTIYYSNFVEIRRLIPEVDPGP